MLANRRLIAIGLALAITSGACRAGGEQASSSPTGASGPCSLTSTAGLKKVTITAPGPGSENAARSYELHVPRDIGPMKTEPLLVSLHGLGANGASQSSVTHWTAFSDSLAATGGSFIVAFPDGIDTLWLWGAEHSYDVNFIFDVIANVSSSGCVDASQIYIDGWSEGAYMAQRMACANADPSVATRGIVIAALHSYAGGNPDAGGETCGPSGHPGRPTRVLFSQGLSDQIVDPQRLGFPAFLAWGKRYSCQASTQPLAVAQSLAGCTPGSRVAWWPISGQGHLIWSCSADLTWHNRGVWTFFSRDEAPTQTTCT